MEKAESISKSEILSGRQVFAKIVIAIIALAILGMACSQYPRKIGGGWYHQLNQPFFAPPYWLPFVMWTLVYILMGCSIGIVWQYAVKSKNNQTASRAKMGLILFAIHLFFNLIFPVILIGFHKPILGLIDMLTLLGFIVFLIRYFRAINHAASNLLIPYFIWIVYAALLNLSIIILN